jgi:hypothetical protein
MGVVPEAREMLGGVDYFRQSEDGAWQKSGSRFSGILSLKRRFAALVVNRPD